MKTQVYEAQPEGILNKPDFPFDFGEIFELCADLGFLPLYAFAFASIRRIAGVAHGGRHRAVHLSCSWRWRVTRDA
jgi:hypothetical protein